MGHLKHEQFSWPVRFWTTYWNFLHLVKLNGTVVLDKKYLGILTFKKGPSIYS